MSNTSTTRSNPALVPPTGNRKRILREQEFSYRTDFNHEGSGLVRDDKREEIHTLDQASQLLDRKVPPPSPHHAPN